MAEPLEVVLDRVTESLDKVSTSYAHAAIVYDTSARRVVRAVVIVALFGLAAAWVLITIKDAVVSDMVRTQRQVACQQRLSSEFTRAIGAFDASWAIEGQPPAEGTREADELEAIVMRLNQVDAICVVDNPPTNPLR